ncbi:MAG: tetratricopeptide repeat protein [Flavobacteriales bacterium]|nr:tetratricopeptide repeat protein [Flavobacteriales bacterium]
MRTIYTILLIAAAPMLVKSQSNLDSLLQVWQDATLGDSVRARAFERYIFDGHLFKDRDTALVLADELMAFSEERKLLDGQISALNLRAIAAAVANDYAQALEINEQIIVMATAKGDQERVANVLGNMGIIYKEQGDLPRALDHYQRSLAINETQGDPRSVVTALTNMAVIHRDMRDMDKALGANLRALKILEEFDEPRLLAGVLRGTGNVYFMMKDYPNALAYHERSLKIQEERGDQLGISMCLVNISNVYYEQDELTPAMDYLQRALAVQERINDRRGLTKSYVQIGRIMLKQGNLRQAVLNCEKSLGIAVEIRSMYDRSHTCDCLYQAYKAMGDERNALRYYEEMITIRDSVFNEDNTKKITQLQMQYEFDKKEAATRAEQEKKDALAAEELRRQKVVRNGFMGGFVLVALFAGVFFTQRNRIGREKARSEELLLNILPEEVAEELKDKGEADAKLIDQVTVLFTDFKGFTAMSEILSPKELVRDLHECFSAFDHICQEHGLEKIKTIGDAYMAAGGLPTPNTTHATDVIKAALAMRDFIAEGKARKLAAGLPYFEIRVGVHTGPVVAGIVGVKKFQYDIWGDTVNTASRMESSGDVGQVNISEATYALVKEQAGLAFTPRGKVQAKGKGELEMYFVNDRA